MKTKNDTLNAIQTMVDSAVNKAGYDKTRNAVIIARNSNNTYNIKMDGIEYDNVVLYGSGVLQTNEIVKVVIPNNQASQMYILGKGVIEGRQQGSVNGLNSNAFGRETVASGGNSFAEGNGTIASGSDSHAEGFNTTASNFASHAEGIGTIASGGASHAQGRFNVANTSHADIVGNGTDGENRSNAYALDWNGNGYYAGDVYVGCKADSSGGMKLAKPYWSYIECNTSVSTSTSYNYFAPTNNNETTAEVRYNNGFEIKRGNLYEYNRNVYGEYFVVPSGVNYVELYASMHLTQDTTSARRYMLQAIKSTDVTQSGGSVRTIADALNFGTESRLSVNGTIVIPVQEGDCIYLRGYKSTASQSVSVTFCYMYIKAIG